MKINEIYINRSGSGGFNFIKRNGVPADTYKAAIDQGKDTGKKVAGLPLYTYSDSTYKFYTLGREEQAIMVLVRDNGIWFSMVYLDPSMRGKGAAIELYKYAIIDDGMTIASDESQTPGSRSIWAKLDSTPGINVYAWDQKSNEFFNWSPEDSPEEEVYVDTAKDKEETSKLNQKMMDIAKAYDNGEISLADARAQNAKIQDEIDAINKYGDTGRKTRLVATAA